MKRNEDNNQNNELNNNQNNDNSEESGESDEENNEEEDSNEDNQENKIFNSKKKQFIFESNEFQYSHIKKYSKIKEKNVLYFYSNIKSSI